MATAAALAAVAVAMVQVAAVAVEKDEAMVAETGVVGVGARAAAWEVMWAGAVRAGGALEAVMAGEHVEEADRVVMGAAAVATAR